MTLPQPLLPSAVFPFWVNNTQYELNIYYQGNPVGVVGVKSSNGVLLPMPQWMIPFGVGVADTTGPSVIAALPVSTGATGVPLNSVAFILSFNDHIDLSTATSGAVTLGINNGALMPSTFLTTLLQRRHFAFHQSFAYRTEYDLDGQRRQHQKCF